MATPKSLPSVQKVGVTTVHKPATTAERKPLHEYSKAKARSALRPRFKCKPKEATGPCPLFAGKQVAASGWCSAWVKKAA